MKLENRPPDTEELAWLDALLDDAPPCECHCRRTLDRHADTDPCQRPATHYVEIHDFGCCQRPELLHSPNRTAEGFRASYMCDRCLKSLIASAEAFLRKIPAGACCPQPPAAPFGCGRPVTRVDDLIPVRRPL